MVQKNQEAFRQLMEQRKEVEQGVAKPKKKKLTVRSKTPSGKKRSTKGNKGGETMNIDTRSGKKSLLHEWREGELENEEPRM